MKKQPEKQKTFQFLIRNRKASAALPQSSLRRRVSLSFSSWAGFLAFGSSLDLLPSHPGLQGQWLLESKIQLADYSGGTAADFHGLSFYPRSSGAPQEHKFSKNN
jgi:hypothetical protein